jgi:hypothetical protein
MGWLPGVGLPAGANDFLLPQRPDRLWGPPSLLHNGYRVLFSWGKAAGA